MHTSLFIAGRLSGSRKNSFSRPIVIIGIAGVAVGLMVMIIAMAVVKGFQREITDKMTGFGAHIQISKYDSNSSFETTPIPLGQPYYPVPDNVKGIRHIQMYAYKAGLLKVDEDVQGVVLKGIGRDYDWTFLNDKIVEGRPISFPDSGTSNEILVAKSLASLLKIQLDDELRMFFLSPGQMQPRGRKFQVAGLFETGIGELDNMFIIGDIAHIRRLNNWQEDEVSGFEVTINDFGELDRIAMELDASIPYDQTALTIRDLYPQMFDWLDLQDINALVIIILMMIVSAITMISTLLIIILENTSAIGVLKALGGNNALIRKIFLALTSRITLWGIVIGDVLGIGLSLLQKYFGIVKLSQESYYMSEVPILLNPVHIVVLNVGVFIICMLTMWLVSLIIAKISPIKTIQS